MNAFEKHDLLTSLICLDFLSRKNFDFLFKFFCDQWFFYGESIFVEFNSRKSKILFNRHLIFYKVFLWAYKTNWSLHLTTESSKCLCWEMKYTMSTCPRVNIRSAFLSNILQYIIESTLCVIAAIFIHSYSWKFPRWIVSSILSVLFFSFFRLFLSLISTRNVCFSFLVIYYNLQGEWRVIFRVKIYSIRKACESFLFVVQIL